MFVKYNGMSGIGLQHEWYRWVHSHFKLLEHFSLSLSLTHTHTKTHIVEERRPLSGCWCIEREREHREREGIERERGHRERERA
jgi:hypothetical protein